MSTNQRMATNINQNTTKSTPNQLGRKNPSIGVPTDGVRIFGNMRGYFLVMYSMYSKFPAQLACGLC